MSTMIDSYERYYSSHHYDERYARPNDLTLERVMKLAPQGSTILDIGCGNGRYALPLALRGYSVEAVERSTEARDQLQARARNLGVLERIQIYSDVEEISDEAMKAVSLAGLLFGVLGHMNFLERTALLRGLAERLSPCVHLVGSVPSRARRFRYEQRSARVDDHGAMAPRFEYVREFGGGRHTFEYSAFTATEVIQELAESGWQESRVSAECIFSEGLVTSSRRLAKVDRWLVRLLPATLGYCVFFDVVQDAASKDGSRFPIRALREKIYV